MVLLVTNETIMMASNLSFEFVTLNLTVHKIYCWDLDHRSQNLLADSLIVSMKRKGIAQLLDFKFRLFSGFIYNLSLSYIDDVFTLTLYWFQAKCAGAYTVSQSFWFLRYTKFMCTYGQAAFKQNKRLALFL